VTSIEKRTREELFPGEPAGSRSGKLYFKLNLGEAMHLGNPLLPRRARRTPFIETTLNKLEACTEFNDLFDDTPEENALWETLKAYRIEAERQWRLPAEQGEYVLDFALFCRDRNLDVEVDGPAHHRVEMRSINDAARDRHLAAKGWGVVRLTNAEVRRRVTYCIERISEAIQRSGGMDGATVVRRVRSEFVTQPALFEERFEYDDVEEDEAE
jgi:very-short-patch-repair endonuclease